MDISSTALLTAAGRARRADISLDRYAAYWMQAQEHSYAPQLGESYAQEVCSREDIGLSLRNRFFLKHLNAFAEAWIDGVFVNLAAGFTSYPYLVDKPVESFEVDLPAVADVKRRRSAELQSQGILPDRKVVHCAVDLSQRDQVDAMLAAISKSADGRPVFLLMEGITYYLDREMTEYIITAFGAMSSTASVVAFDFWRPAAQEHQVFAKLSAFYSTTLSHWGGFTLIDDTLLRGLSPYQIEELSDAIAQEVEVLGEIPEEAATATFLEHYAILVRR